jgi:hypothetical protein
VPPLVAWDAGLTHCTDDGDVTAVMSYESAERTAVTTEPGHLARERRPENGVCGLLARTGAPSPVTVNTDSSPVTKICAPGRPEFDAAVPRHRRSSMFGCGGKKSTGHVDHEPYRVVHVQLRGQPALQPRSGIKVDFAGQGYYDAVTLAATRYL